MGTPRSFLSLAAIGFRRSKPTTSAASASRFLDSHRFATSSPQPPPSDSPSVIKPFAQTGPPDDEPKKGLLAKLYDRYSLASSQNRIVLGERFFHAARRRASDPKWHTHAHVPNNFRSRQALLTLHVWFLHRRLIADSSQDKDQWLIVQEEMFDSLWNDARCRIRAEGVNELTVNKHLKDVQSITFRLCTHLDHAFEEHQDDAEKRYEEIAGAIWVNMWNREEDAPHDAMRRWEIDSDAHDDEGKSVRGVLEGGERINTFLFLGSDFKPYSTAQSRTHASVNLNSPPFVLSSPYTDLLAW